MAGATNAYATSECYQWQFADVYWHKSPAEACVGWSIPSCGTDYNAPANGGAYPVGDYPNYGCRRICTVTSTGVTFTADYAITVRTNPDGCQVYVSSLLDALAQCGPSCNAVGEPINPANGGVLRSESDSASRADVTDFKRFYNSTDSNDTGLGAGWKGSFARSVKPVYSSSSYRAYISGSDNSSLYNDESTACVSGFAQIKSRVSTWANATASYNNGACHLTVGSIDIGMLPVLYTSPPTPAPGSTAVIGYDITRDDGQVVRFSANDSLIVAPSSIAMRLQQTASGYTLTDANDNVEMYDASGKLLSVTSRAGVVQTMSYDVSGRLNSVTDSFGRQLTLTYDAQGHLLSMAQQ